MSTGTSSGFFSGKKFLSFLDINWDIISHMAKICWQAWQKWIVSVHEKFWRNLILRKTNFFFNIFGHRGKQNRRFEDIFFNRIVETLSSRSRETLWLNTFLEGVSFFYNFGTLREKMSVFWRKIFNRVLKVAFFVSRKTFWSVLFRRSYFFESLLNIRRKKSDFVETFTAVLLTFHSKCTCSRIVKSF